MSNQVSANQVLQPLRYTESIGRSDTSLPSSLSPVTTQKVTEISERDQLSTGQQNSETDHEIDSAISQLNDYAQNFKRELHFSVDEASGRTVIKVTDPETEEIIRQIPPEEVLRIAESLEDNSGLLLRAQV